MPTSAKSPTSRKAPDNTTFRMPSGAGVISMHRSLEGHSAAESWLAVAANPARTGPTPTRQPRQHTRSLAGPCLDSTTHGGHNRPHHPPPNPSPLCSHACLDPRLPSRGCPPTPALQKPSMRQLCQRPNRPNTPPSKSSCFPCKIALAILINGPRFAGPFGHTPVHSAPSFHLLALDLLCRRGVDIEPTEAV